ncbi:MULTISPECIES: alpha/beta fold hydrolase [unclassified Sphingomonas]|uniref:alpha/beta hydrolase family protein n=1 Tax=unclassified Sphingomonas TaxID=196159 RepID=UPI000928CDBA|nr:MULTISPECIES: alpha/beta fold hydrolase [unclassified Sphingomonas]MBN8846531.1 alpha/beta hydrolase [Sphingomonas sp.]OJV32239.1 MAG: alpha/beta hydrolase [Sphingomonas sp. 67-36]
MFEPFPGNYVWNLSVNICLSMGGAIGEIDEANAPVREAATAGDDAGTEAFFTAWMALADRLDGQGRQAEAAGNPLTASGKYARALAYAMTAERMQDSDYAPRKAAYARMLEMRDAMIRTGGIPCEAVEIHYKDSVLPALFLPGDGPGPWPCMIFCNGLDSVKEMIFLINREAFARRGIALLIIDQPGVGGALRRDGLTAVVESERWAGAAVDYLETRPDVIASRIGIVGWSLGGYYAPRAACYEKRLKLCVAWGANHDWGALQHRRAAREGDRPVPHYWKHVCWVWGQPDAEALLAMSDRITLRGHLKNMTVPFLVTHGANDRQIPVSYAHESYEEAINSPDRELKIFTAVEGGIEHTGADNIEPVRSFVADWVAARL